MARFNEECVEVEDLTVSSVIMALLRGTKDEYFKRSLTKSGPKAMVDLRLQVEKYMNSKEAL